MSEVSYPDVATRLQSSKRCVNEHGRRRVIRLFNHRYSQMWNSVVASRRVIDRRNLHVANLYKLERWPLNKRISSTIRITTTASSSRNAPLWLNWSTLKRSRSSAIRSFCVARSLPPVRRPKLILSGCRLHALAEECGSRTTGNSEDFRRRSMTSGRCTRCAWLEIG